MVANLAAAASNPGAQLNGSGATTPRPNDNQARSSSPPSSTSKWRWGALPSSWRSGSLSSAGVSLLNGAGMFTSGASTPSIATEEERQAMFTPPAEVDKQLTDEPIPELVNGEKNGAPPNQAHHQRVVPSQRPSSLSQSYAPGQQVPIRRARASTSPMLPSFVDHEAWFNDSKFDGSFPSRVLPFLYLGNL